MSSLSIYNYCKEGKYCASVNLFQAIPEADGDADISSSTNRDPTVPVSPLDSEKASKLEKDQRFSVIVDSESCLDRLYGGYYSDWASGGQWNRMLGFILNLSRACRLNGIQLGVAMRGGVEKEHASAHFKANRDFRERLGRMMVHLKNRGTPPPKVWWLPPTCLREVMRLVLQISG